MSTDVMKTTPKPTFIPDLERSSAAPDLPGWAQNLRRQGLERFLELGIPTVKHEEWKYTNLAELSKGTFRLPQAAGKTAALDGTARRYINDDELNIVFVNGVLSKDLSNIRALRGVRVETLYDAVRSNSAGLETMLKRYDVNEEAPFPALNRALLKDGVYVAAEKGAVVPELIHIVHLMTREGKGLIHSPRTLINLERSSEISVLESFISFDDDIVYFANPVTDIALAENAVIHYCKAQGESRKAFHIGTTRAAQERNSNFNGFSFMTGALLTRNNLDLTLDDEGGSATLNGLYSLGGHQLADNHTTVDHRLPNCVSNQLYKGVLNGSSHAVFNGKIFVRPIAQKTNSYQLNKNLLLGKDCRVDTKPQLEIFADDVKCTHGATIGQLNEDELFYLQTRCIPRKDAVRMLAKGFVDDIISRIPNASVDAKLHILLEPTFTAID